MNKYNRCYLYGGWNGKKCDDDFVVKYKTTDNAHVIDVVYYWMNNKYYVVDYGKTFDKLKDAKRYIEGLDK